MPVRIACTITRCIDPKSNCVRLPSSPVALRGDGRYKEGYADCSGCRKSLVRETVTSPLSKEGASADFEAIQREEWFRPLEVGRTVKRDGMWSLRLPKGETQKKNTLKGGKKRGNLSLGGEINYLGQEHKDKRLSCGTFHEVHSSRGGGSNKVVGIIKRNYINFPKHDQWFGKFSDQVEYHISCDISLEFILAAFPVKSCNLDKTLGKFPDKAEELAIHSMKIIAEHVEAVYPPGVHYNIVSDGHVFSDLGKIFSNAIPFKTLLTSNAETARRALMCLFGSDVSSITRDIKEDLETRNLYRGFSRFMLEDLYEHEPCKALPTKSAKKKLCSKVGFLMIQRNRAYSAMVEWFPSNYVSQSTPVIRGEDLPRHKAVVELANGKFVLLHSRVIHRSGDKISEDCSAPRAMPWCSFGIQMLRTPPLAIAHGPPMSTKFSLLPLHGCCPQDYNLEYCVAPRPGPILFCFSYGCCSSRYLVANPLSGRYTQVHALIETCVNDFKTKLSSLVFLALWLLQLTAWIYDSTTDSWAARSSCIPQLCVDRYFAWEKGGGGVSYSFD
ncbi:hypothetical protein SELMODRAFT_410977 [Selaginella moellendorffii]|uniref:Uncharacterized protein n=1 Tax=Selaginella moellendorffii TaxID=88036 RepID=D8RHL8_SELML|nr:hypothetical protein SELMODRAFT_410977 [Selaginella moellendorffii]